MGKTDIIYKLDYMLDVLDDLRGELDFISDKETIDYIDEAIDCIDNIKYNVVDMEDMED